MRRSLLTSLQRFPGARRASGPPLALWLRRHALSGRGSAAAGDCCMKAQIDPVAPDVERHGVDGDAAGDLAQSRLRARLPAPVGQGLCHRLAGRGRDRLHDHAGLPPPDRPHRRAPGAIGLMLSALDLARRIEAGDIDAARGGRAVRRGDRGARERDRRLHRARHRRRAPHGRRPGVDCRCAAFRSA